jgi:hypothetical protein
MWMQLPSTDVSGTLINVDEVTFVTLTEASGPVYRVEINTTDQASHTVTYTASADALAAFEAIEALVGSVYQLPTPS